MSEKQLQEIFNSALRGLGVQQKVTEERIRTFFAEIVGPALAPMCEAVSLERGVLLVATDNGALAQQLHAESVAILNALNERLGAGNVRRMRFTAKS